MDRTSLEHHLSHLKDKHAELDKQIQEGYTHYLSDKNLNKMKFEKAAVKRHIAETEEKLKKL